MIGNKRSVLPAPDVLDEAGLDFIANAPQSELHALVTEEGTSADALAARAAAAVGRALKIHDAQRLHARLRALAGRPLPSSRRELLELATMLHEAAASTGLMVSLQQVDLDALDDEQLRALVLRLQEICREGAVGDDLPR